MTNPLTPNQLNQYLKQLNLPKPNSRKGENGKLLIIGGSHLFHAASRWSLDIASKLVDMVFYSSVPSNNRLIHEAKQNFWNGIVVPRNQLENYLQEADCILIGPGMERQEINSDFHYQSIKFYLNHPPSDTDWNNNTQHITNYLLAKYPEKKWVIDAGALQMLSPHLLSSSCVITPHHKELEIIMGNSGLSDDEIQIILKEDLIKKTITEKFGEATVLLKGQFDQVFHQDNLFLIEGGNAGMTKGGTGDVLAGLLAGLYTNNDILTSAICASHINKKAGEKLFEKQGPFFNATDLVKEIPELLWDKIKKNDIKATFTN